MAWNGDGGDGWDDGEGNKGNDDAGQFGGGADFGDDDLAMNEKPDDDFKCRRCGQAGHMARNCPDAPEGGENDGKCFNCGEEGHKKSDCTKPRTFKGECRICKQAGHPASECPEKPAERCFNCKKEGHTAVACKEKRVFDYAGTEDLPAQDAWNKVVDADMACELEDVRSALRAYSRAVPEVTYEEIEKAFRQHEFNTYLIATVKELPKTHTFVDLQGNLDQTYQVGFHLSDKPRRANAIAAWPKSAQENMERLKDAGLPMERGIPLCPRCNELGHTARSCSQEYGDAGDRVQVKCVNCDEVGHRARDCPTPRVDRFACRNCKQPGHQASECTEPRSAAGVECKKCGEVGHFARDCTVPEKCRNCGEPGHISKECDKPRNPDTVVCRNCEQTGHFSKECPLPRDYSKVKCQNCGEMGHTKVRCKAPPADDNDNGYGADSGGGEGFHTSNTGHDDTAFDQAAVAGGDDWPASNGDNWGMSTGEPAAISAGGGW